MGKGEHRETSLLIEGFPSPVICGDGIRLGPRYHSGEIEHGEED